MILNFHAKIHKNNDFFATFAADNMKKLINIIIASIIGFLILGAGMTRFHHHNSDEKVCFCVDFITDVEGCHHHHSNHNAPLAPFSSESESSCPLHIDLYQISENHNHIHISDDFCDNHNCDICSPEIYTPDYAVVNLYISPKLSISERDGYDSALSRRGPPTIFA